MDSLRISLQILRQVSRIMNRMRYTKDGGASGEILQVISSLKTIEKIIIQEIAAKESK